MSDIAIAKFEKYMIGQQYNYFAIVGSTMTIWRAIHCKVGRAITKLGAIDKI